MPVSVLVAGPKGSSFMAAVVEGWVVCAPVDAVDAGLGIRLGMGDGSRDVAASGTMVLGESERASVSGNRGKCQYWGSWVAQMPAPGAAAADPGAAAAETQE